MSDKLNSNLDSVGARPELLDVIDSIAKEKFIPLEDVFLIVEEALSKLSSNKYGNEYDIAAMVDRNTGSLLTYRLWYVYPTEEEIEDFNKDISIEKAKIKFSNPDIQEGIHKEPLPNINFNRFLVQNLRHLIVQYIWDLEKENEYEFYKDSVGEIVNGIVKKAGVSGYIVSINRAEAFLPAGYAISSEKLDSGSRVRAIIASVKRDNKGHQILLSRASGDFVKKLFSQEVQEIFDGQIEVKAIARDAGSRTKIAVSSNDPSIDAVSACIGFRGSKIKPIITELAGEKIDVIGWDDDIVNFALNIFSNCSVKKIIANEDLQCMSVVVDEDNLSLAIGRAGQNVRLASKLLGWKIDFLNEDEEKKRFQEKLKEKSEIFMEALDIDDVISQLLIMAGFDSLESINNSSEDQLLAIDGFSAELVSELKTRALKAVEVYNAAVTKRLHELGVKDEFINFTGLEISMLEKLVNADVKSIEEFAELSKYDLMDILGENSIPHYTADELIMTARDKISLDQ